MKIGKQLINNSLSKTVYILGAGYSHEASFPLQNQILDNLDKIDETISKELINFLKRVFGKTNNILLEDIFTLLDQCISKREFFAGYNFQELDEIRNKFKRGILYIFYDYYNKLSGKKSMLDFYRTNSAFFIKQRIEATTKGDPISIISLNWDTLLDNSLYWFKSHIKQKIDIDYCCYTNPLNSSPHCPSVLQKAKNIYNVKVLKLHGSCNWLICPSCNRIFTGISANENFYGNYIEEKPCPKCTERMIIQEVKPPILIPYLVTPTFLKVFDNTHIQMIWYNAFVELTEASKIVFIGYSLPDSDYHLRTLFRRAIQKDVSIEIVLADNDKPNKNTKKSLKKYFAVNRFEEFFSDFDNVNIVTEGAKKYFEKSYSKKSIKTFIENNKVQK